MSEEKFEPVSAPQPDETYPWKAWRVRNPKGRIGSAIGVAVFGALAVCGWLWWPLYTALLFGLLEALSVLRFYQEWAENGAWAK
ncbi:MAG: hypothetical protein V1934_05915 [Methanobacteriota archaeon]